jgi:UDP-glucose:(glucosyl)LPS alpha-1,2-glucosyltransferase
MIEFDEFSKNASGGTEIIKQELQKRLPEELLSKFQIICDRVGELQKNKIKLFWVHNTPEQLDYSHLNNNGWKKFSKIIFISHNQRDKFIQKYNIPYSHCSVISYGINPILLKEKTKEKITLIYHPTPYRGLKLLFNTFQKLCKEYNNLELKIFSSYSIHGLHDNQNLYESSNDYQRIDNHPNIKNIGFVSNEKIREELSTAHIFGYPNIYEETFCLSLLEAMSAGYLCVHPKYGYLYETASKWTIMYDYHEDEYEHQQIFYKHLKNAIDTVNTQKVQDHLKMQNEYVTYFHNWSKITKQWIYLLESIEKEHTIITYQ